MKTLNTGLLLAATMTLGACATPGTRDAGYADGGDARRADAGGYDAPRSDTDNPLRGAGTGAAIGAAAGVSLYP